MHLLNIRWNLCGGMATELRKTNLNKCLLKCYREKLVLRKQKRIHNKIERKVKMIKYKSKIYFRKKSYYKPSSNPWKFRNIKSVSKDRFHSHLEIWRLSKAYSQTTNERPLPDKLHPNQNLKHRVNAS